jgi:hypothetical protein
MERLRSLIKEVLSTPPKKKDCNCGCHTCENVGNPGVLINENVAPKEILSENLRYHVQNKLPLTENTFRYGSKSFLNLWSEARYLYLREIIHVNEDDKEILLETNLGEYGIYEGQKVPLDMPMLEEGIIVITNGKQRLAVDIEDFKRLKSGKDIVGKSLEHAGQEEWALARDNWEFEKALNLNESEYQGKDVQLNKPKRGGSKAYYVYVRNPKTKKIKKVSFGSGGLKAKINNPKARQAFAKRHRCSEKNDKTKASYWSCRLPRYAKLLGLKSSFSGFW